jgi:peptidoglycan hydrolase CwlO-like protein
MDKPNPKFFKVYVGVSLLIIILLLGSLVGVIGYGASKIKSETNTVNNKISSFNQSINTVNHNLQNINSQLQNQTNKISNLNIPGL